MNNVGQRIRDYRERKGISQRRLAALIGHKRESYIGRIERGEALRPGSEIILKIASVLECTANDLLGGRKDSRAA
jgi:transcriptional regulator with XRE-family HTH domain